MRPKIVVTPTTSGAEALALLLGERLDLLFMGITPFVLAKTYGIPVRIIASSQGLVSSHGVFLRKGIDIESRTLPLVIGTTHGSTGHQVGRSWASKISKDVRFVNIPPQHQLAAFSSGNIDGIASWQPFITLCGMNDGECVFTTAQLDVPIYNTLVATDQALETKGHLIRRFLDAHEEGVRCIRGASIQAFTGLLPHIFSPLIPPQAYERMLQRECDWPEDVFRAPPAVDGPLYAAIAETLRFLREDKLAGHHDVEVTNCFPNAALPCTAGAEGETLRAGRSDSTMCAPFHMARVSGAFDRQGFDIGLELRAATEQALEHALELSDEMRKQLVEIVELKKNPGLALTQMRRCLEGLLRETYLSFFGRLAPRSLEQLIESLYKGGDLPMPADVYSAMHWIRVIGNAATHATGTTASESKQFDSALLHFVSVVRWADGPRKQWLAASKACTKCGEQMQREWEKCPTCGRHSTCPQCHRVAEVAWKSCAACGTKLE